MVAARTTSFFVYTIIAGAFGLFGAGVPKLLDEHQDFSWAGFSAGAGCTLLALAVVRLLRGAAKPKNSITPLERRIMGSGLILFVATVFLFSLTLHTDWVWPRRVMPGTIIAGAVTVLMGLLTSWLSPRPEA